MSFGSWLLDWFSLTGAEPVPEPQATSSSSSYTASFAAVAGPVAEEPEAESVQSPVSPRAHSETRFVDSQQIGSVVLARAIPLEFPRAEGFEFPLIEFSRD